MKVLKRILPLACAALLAACAGTPEENDPAALTDFVVERELGVVWSRSIGNGQGRGLYQLRPAIEGDTVYVASADGLLMALDSAKGKPRWKRKLDDTISGGVGVDGNNLYLGTTEGGVIALNLQGEEVWRATVSGEVLAPPVSDGSLLIVQSYDGKIVAFDVATGEEKWAYSVSVPRLTLRGTSTPVISGQVVLAGLANGRMIALDKDSGELRWEQRVSVAKGSTEIERLADVDGSILVDNGIAYAAGYQGKLIAVDIRSGRPLWERDLSSHTGPVQGYGNIYIADAAGAMQAFEANGQGVIWTQTVLARRRLNQVNILGGSLVVADFEGYLHFISQVDGHLVSRVRVDRSGVRAPMLVDGDVLYVYSNAGRLVAYSFDRGTTHEPRRFGPKQPR